MRIQDAFAETLESQARWREAKAEEYPGNKRNQTWAEGAQRAADYVRTLPEDDIRLRQIAAAGGWPDVDVISLGQEASQFAGRCDMEPDQFLTELADIAVAAEVHETATDLGRDPMWTIC